MPLMFLLSLALGLKVRALGGSSGWINFHFSSVISLKSVSCPSLSKGKSITNCVLDQFTV